MYRNNGIYSAAGLALLLVLLVLSQKSREGVTAMKGALIAPEASAEQLASPSSAITKIGPLEIAVSLVHDANAQIAEDVRFALDINSMVFNGLVLSFSASVSKARLSLTPTLHDARYVRDNAFPVVASMPQSQVVAEAGRGLVRDFKEGIEQNQASAVAIFDGKRSEATVLAPSASEDGGKILDTILPIVDASIMYAQRGISYCLDRVSYLLPDYTKQARILMEAGSREAQYLWGNKSKFLDTVGN